jgi:hypothetical protein
MKPVSSNPNSQELAVQIVRFVDDDRFPGWVACEFEDAMATKHVIIDKVPIFTTEMLDANSSYPQAGTVPCTVLSREKDSVGRELVRITTSSPVAIESTTGISEFIVSAAQISG